MTTLTKKELVNIYAEKKNLKKNETEALLEDVFATLQEIVTEYGAGFKLGAIGTLKVDVKSAQVHRNPQTGEEVPKPAHHVLKFKVHQATKDQLKDIPVEG